jgi:hypothetical protein
MSGPEALFGVLVSMTGGFCIGLTVGRAQADKARRDFEEWRAGVLETMAQDAKDARNWSKFTDHVIAMDERRGK